MHIMVKCEDMSISRVLIDNGSALNVCPMSTIERLNVDTSLIHPTMIIRAFDGTLREVQGKIELAIGIGPLFFMVNFQVIKMDSPYNMQPNQGSKQHFKFSKSSLNNNSKHIDPKNAHTHNKSNQFYISKNKSR